MAFGNLDAVLITTTTNALLQASGTGQMIFTSVIAVNTDTDARKVSIWRGQVGTSPGSGALLLWDAQPVPAGGTIVVPISGKALVNQENLFASASVANVVTLSIDYLQP